MKRVDASSLAVSSIWVVPQELTLVPYFGARVFLFLKGECLCSSRLLKMKRWFFDGVLSTFLKQAI
jgi:hypothetical protein